MLPGGAMEAAPAAEIAGDRYAAANQKSIDR
jgi:hypothetical protein